VKRKTEMRSTSANYQFLGQIFWGQKPRVYFKILGFSNLLTKKVQQKSLIYQSRSQVQVKSRLYIAKSPNEVIDSSDFE